MAHTGIFCTKAEIDYKVGENVDATGYTEANINYACFHAESYINVACHYNFSDSYSSENVDTKYLLSEAAACFIAVDFIAYNMSGYTTRYEAEDMINLHWAKFKRCLDLLKESRNVDFIKSA